MSSDQFGEQTAIKTGKGGLKGISLSSAQVAEWINSFPISAYITDTLDHCYSPDEPESSSEMLHTEKGVKRCKVDEDDHPCIRTELAKCSHPLETDNDDLYNIFKGQVAPTNVNVADSLSFGEPMVAEFRNSHSTQSSHPL